MKDELILELFWKRDEVAILKTQEKYEAYLIKVAYSMLILLIMRVPVFRYITMIP